MFTLNTFSIQNILWPVKPQFEEKPAFFNKVMYSVCTASTLQVASGAHTEPEQFFQTQRTISPYNLFFIHLFHDAVNIYTLCFMCVCSVNKLWPKNRN